ncbi:endonuclease/exonuclease/phosphatase family protein [Agromyces sp. MMS24-K17]|uniref:endonuclease/exonuclease/phosphatase family protein n=1 Tax=Agromyces sp. MMS24-K17 TaxID=3372850 RepID=UPI0037552AC4
MLSRALGWIAVLAGFVLAGILVWPQAVGLNDQWIAAHVVALRGAGAIGAVALAVVAAALTLVRPVRRAAIAVAAILAFFAAGNAAVLAVRGFGGGADAPTGAAATADGDVTVLSWNTLGEVPEVGVVVDLAVSEGADVIVLPETTEEFGEDLAVAMRDAGDPMWVHTQSFDHISKARSTTLLVSPRLGDYTVVSAEWPGPPDNTNTLPTVVAVPVNGVGPEIIAVHAVAPIRWELRNWRSDLDWLASLCDPDGSGLGTAGGGDAGVIMAGDFNATLDHFAGRGVDGGNLGACHDAAAATGSAALGTWPTDVPSWLGSPIDHVLATDDWQVSSFRVVDELDDAGSDHRPVVARLAPTG